MAKIIGNTTTTPMLVDQEYNPESKKPQSGKAVAQALENKLNNLVYKGTPVWRSSTFTVIGTHGSEFELSGISLPKSNDCVYTIEIDINDFNGVDPEPLLIWAGDQTGIIGSGLPYVKTKTGIAISFKLTKPISSTDTYIFGVYYDGETEYNKTADFGEVRIYVNDINALLNPIVEISDIETALDTIIAIQNQLIGGDS